MSLHYHQVELQAVFAAISGDSSVKSSILQQKIVDFETVQKFCNLFSILVKNFWFVLLQLHPRSPRENFELIVSWKKYFFPTRSQNFPAGAVKTAINVTSG